jgi:hypothetical protein
MSNPNIAGASTTIYGTTTYYTPSGTTAVILLANASGSNSVYKINQIVAANVNGSSAVNATVSIYAGSSVTTQGSAPASGTAYPVVSTVSVPANASLIVTDKTTAIYLMENQLISVTSGTASGITYSVSYEVIS